MSDENAALARTRIAYLESLGDELRDRGFAVRLMVPQGGPPSLHVVNPLASALAENILAENIHADGTVSSRPGSGNTAGTWWFWWSWAERIAPADDPGEAADRVARVLAASGEYTS